MASEWFKPIVPKTKFISVVKPDEIKRKCAQEMQVFLKDLWRDCANYEVPPTPLVIGKAARGYTTKAGKKLRAGRRTVKGYVRTLTLKKSWSQRGPYRIPGGGIEGAVVSSGQIAPYNKLVRGTPEQQSEVMKKRGWKPATEFLKYRWVRFKRRLSARLLK